MKPLFLSVVALLIGLPAQAETTYLILRYYEYVSGSATVSMVTVPMESQEQCNIAGAQMKSSKRFTKDKRAVGFECIEGK